METLLRMSSSSSPLGFGSPSHTFLEDNSSLAQDVLSFEEFIDMRAVAPDDSSWQSPHPPHPPPPLQTNSILSPGSHPADYGNRHYRQQTSSEGNSSPVDTSTILTPSSASLEYYDHHGTEVPDDGLSPTSNLSPIDDYVVISSGPSDESVSRIRSTANNQPPPSTSGVFRQSLPARRFYDTTTSPPLNAQPMHTGPWSHLAAGRTSIAMDRSSYQNQQDAFTLPDELDSIEASIMQNDSNFFDGVTAPGHAFSDHFNAAMPYRASRVNAYAAAYGPCQQPANTQTLPQAHQPAFNSFYRHHSEQQQQYHQQQHQPQAFPAELFVHPAYTTTMIVQRPHAFAPALNYPQNFPQMHHPTQQVHSQHPFFDPAAYHQANLSLLSPPSATSDAHRDASSPATMVSASVPPSVKATSPAARPRQSPATASESSKKSQKVRVRSPQTEYRSKGGRRKGVRLAENSRQKSHQMRKVGACWRCAIQRDSCDDGSPCQRCMMQTQRGRPYFFPCERSKLPDLVHEFLPPTMTFVHQKQSIEDYTVDQVLKWHPNHHIDVYLSCGYGPALRWTVFEFSPKTEELLKQFQYFQNPATGQSELRVKYSPPYGLMKIETSDEAHLENYLHQLLDKQYLTQFGFNCYEEECGVDQGRFQAGALSLMCDLYLEISEDNEGLKLLLRDIIRMMIVTFIMGHTLTITEDTLGAVISSVRHTRPPIQSGRHISPRLANRQLKFFFHVFRQSIYEKLLKWEQATLHAAANKEETWLQSFCVILGFAMVLEEVQRTLLIQADAKVQKEESSPESAKTEARNACGRIDDRFKLLVGLFQCKYRDRKWGSNGSFGPGTPEFADGATRKFLRGLRQLVERRRDHLQSRADVEFSLENQCLYTTRLTARFLLPFLRLPST